MVIGVENIKVLKGHCAGNIINFSIEITEIYNSDCVRETFILPGLNMEKKEETWELGNGSHGKWEVSGLIIP